METFSLGTNPPISAPFKGFSSNNPDLLDPGVFTQADNAVWDSGILRTRPGLRAQLTTPLGQIGSGVTFVAYDGNAYALVVAGGANNAGIYLWKEDDAAPTAVALWSPVSNLGVNPTSIPVLFNRDAVQFAIYGDFIFISGATDNKLYRFRFLTTGFLFESATGLLRPTYGLTSALTNADLVGLVAGVTPTTRFAQDVGNGDMAVPDSDFTSGAIATAWTIVVPPVELDTNVDPANLGDKYCRMDDGEIILTTGIAVPDKTNTQDSRTGRKPIHFHVKVTMARQYDRESMLITLIGYDVSGNELGRSPATVFKNAAFGIGSAVQEVQAVIALPLTERGGLDNIKVRVTPGPTNVATGAFGPWFRDLQIFPDCALYILDNSTGVIGVKSYYLQNQPGSGGPIDSPITYNTVSIGEDRLSYHFASDPHFEQVAKIAIPYTEAIPFASFPLRLGLRSGIGADPTYTDILERFTDDDGQKYLVTDLSVLTTPQRTTIQYLEFYFESDLPVPAGYTNYGQTLFTLGDILQAGRLTADANYSYRVREYDTDNSGVIVSPATDRTGAILATRAKAQGQVTFSAGPPTNTALTNRPPLMAGTHSASIEVWRDGGTFEDGLDRLVARFQSGASITFATNGGLWAWDDMNHIFTDNTPDILLIGAATLEDHDATPTSIVSLATFASRLVASIGAVLHLSQAITGRATGLYWTNVYDPEAPNAESQGQVKSISGGAGFAGSEVVSMTVHLSRLAILMANTMFLLVGTRPPFEIPPQQADTNYGGISHQSVIVSSQELVYLSEDGLRVYNGRDTSLLTRDIEQLLNPYGLLNGPALNVAAYKLAFVSAQASRVYLSAPLPGGSAIAVLYIYDRRVGVWTRWLTGNLSGCLRFADADKVYFTGANGQIYRLGPEWGDTATRVGSATGVTLTLTGRNFMNRGRSITGQRFTANVECADATPSYVFTATADEDGVAKRFTYTIAPGTGRKRLPLKKTRPGEKVSPNVDGARLALGLTVTTINPVTLHSWELNASIGVP